MRTMIAILTPLIGAVRIARSCPEGLAMRMAGLGHVQRADGAHPQHERKRR